MFPNVSIALQGGGRREDLCLTTDILVGGKLTITGRFSSFFILIKEIALKMNEHLFEIIMF